MQRPSFHTIYMQLAQLLAQRSSCIKKQVGAVITRDTRVVTTGYNGPLAGTYNCHEKWPQKGCPRSLRGGCSLAIHAEHNAILYALQSHVQLAGSTLYVTLSPCLPCARLILSVGIQHVLYQDSYAKLKNLDHDEGIAFLREFNVHVDQYTTPLKSVLT
ncbi:MAG: dCMP deaminase family protein [Bacteroidota bacterium]